MKTIALQQSIPPTGTDRLALNEITNAVAKSHEVVALVGAGISCSAGIPDFRSSTGLYSSTSSTAATPSLKTLFTSTVLSSPTLLSSHLRTMSSSHLESLNATPTATHEFLSLLSKKRKLLRCYSQNIDGLEVDVGLRAERVEGCFASTSSSAASGSGEGKEKDRERGTVVQLHGSLRHVKCTKCDWVGDWLPSHTESFSQGLSEDCPGCLELAELRALSLKRSIPIKSYLRPSITLYSEPPSPTLLSSTLTISNLATLDLGKKVDVVLVMGTSLKIPGFKNLVKEFAKGVRERREKDKGKGKAKNGGVVVFVNKEPATKEWEKVFDYQIVTESDTFVNYVTNQWKKSRNDEWTSNQTSLLDHLGGSTKVAVSSSSAKGKPPTKRTPLSPLSSNILPPLPLPPSTSFLNSLPSTPPFVPPSSTSTPTKARAKAPTKAYTVKKGLKRQKSFEVVVETRTRVGGEGGGGKRRK